MSKRRTARIEEHLLAGIAEGRTLAALCRELCLQRIAVHGWLEDPTFAERMAQARALGREAIAEQMLDIADDSRNDWVARAAAAENDPPVRNPENIARSKLRIETRLRLLARWDPEAAVPAGAAAEDIGRPAPSEPVAIAARLASLLATIDGRGDPGQDGEDVDDPE